LFLEKINCGILVYERFNKNRNANDFFENVAQIIEQARRFVGRTADFVMCVTYFKIYIYFGYNLHIDMQIND